MNKKIISIIVTIIILGVFFAVLIHSELSADHKRFIIKQLPKLSETIIGQTIHYPANFTNIDIHYVEILPGAESGWHIHENPLIVTMLQGDLTIKYSIENATNNYNIVKKFQLGDTFIEAINTKHNAVNEGLFPVKYHVVSLNPGENWPSIYNQEK